MKVKFSILVVAVLAIIFVMSSGCISPFGNDDTGETQDEVPVPSYQMIDKKKGDTKLMKETFDFTYDKKSWHIVASVPKYRYENYVNEKYVVNQVQWYDYEPPHQRGFITDEYLLDIVEQFKTQNGKLTDDELIHVLAYFVQTQIDYKLDAVVYGKEYTAYPMQAIMNRAGDCDCKAVLLSGLLYHAGYDTIYVGILPDGMSTGHALVGICYDGLNTHSAGKHLMYNGKKYYLIESTNYIPIGLHNFTEEELAKWLYIEQPGRNQLIENGEITADSRFKGWMA